MHSFRVAPQRVEQCGTQQTEYSTQEEKEEDNFLLPNVDELGCRKTQVIHADTQEQDYTWKVWEQVNFKAQKVQ